MRVLFFMHSDPAEEKMYTKPLTGPRIVYTVESPSTFSGPSSKGPGRIVTLRAAISAESEGMEPPASLLKG